MLTPINRISQGSLSNPNQSSQNSNTPFSNILQTATTSLDSWSKAQTASNQNNYDATFRKAADTYGVSIQLLKAVAKAESNFKADAVSHCGAQGVMQLMPKTAAALGVTDSFDPEQNIMGGAKLLGSLLNKYNGDVKLTLAAYNAGSGNVAKYGGIPPFTETKNYVEKVMKDLNNPTYLSQTPTPTSALPSLSPTSQIRYTNLTPDYANTGLAAIFDEEDYERFLKVLDVTSLF